MLSLSQFPAVVGDKSLLLPLPSCGDDPAVQEIAPSSFPPTFASAITKGLHHARSIFQKPGLSETDTIILHTRHPCWPSNLPYPLSHNSASSFRLIQFVLYNSPCAGPSPDTTASRSTSQTTESQRDVFAWRSNRSRRCRSGIAHQGIAEEYCRGVGNRTSRFRWRVA